MMGLLNELLGEATGTNNQMLSERDIATDMLKDSKFGIISLAQSISEVQHPMLRQKMKQQLLNGLRDHHAISDLALGKGWYKPLLTPAAQLGRDVSRSQQSIHPQ